MAEEIKNTAQTNEGTVTPSADNAGAGNITEENEGFTGAEGANGEGGAVNTGEAEAKKRNAEAAKRRREAEQAERIKKAEINAIKKVLKENPYTHQPIETEADVEEYLVMRDIEAQGGEPVTDYFKHAREKRAQKQTEADNVKKLEKEIEDFSAKYPDLNVREVLNNEDFIEYADGKKGNLVKLYEDYQNFIGKFSRMAEENASRAAVQAAANAASAVGSLNNSGTAAESDFFTLEQVRAMSREEIKRNYEKIRKSQAKW